MMSRIGNSVFFIGLILLTLAAIVGMPLAVPIGVVAVLLIAVGWWMWGKKNPTHAEEVPLSQKPAKTKLIAGIPAIACIALSIAFPQFSKPLITAGWFLLAYAIAGLVEMQIDRSFPNAKEGWEALAGWKKFLISAAVIALAVGLFLSIMMFV